MGTILMPEKDPALEAVEASKRIAKLDLETRALTRSLSFWGTGLEWLKAASVPVAVVGIVVTFALGIAQIHRSEQQLLSDQFDKILTRMLGGQPQERVAAVGRLTLFLAEERKEFHQSALTYLVSAASVETDSAVQVTLLNALASLKSDLKLSSSALDAALQLSIAHSRRLMQSAMASGNREAERNEYLDVALSESHRLRDAPQTRQAMARLRHTDYLAFFDRFYPRDYHVRIPHARGRDPANTLRIDPDLKELSSLSTLAGIIEQLIARGARAVDYSGIYCERCDFTKATRDHFVGAKFYGAVLRDADFSSLNLQHAQFIDADLRGTIFFRTDLSDSVLRWVRPREAYRPDLQRRIMMSASRGQPAFPFLECSNLDGARLDGLVVGAMQIHWGNATPVIVITRPRLQSVRFERKPILENVRLLVEAQIPDDWPQSHALDDSVLANVRRFGDGKVSTADDIIRSELFNWGHSSVLRALGGDATHSERERTVNILTLGRVVLDPRTESSTETIGAVEAILSQKLLVDLGIGPDKPADPLVARYPNLGKTPLACDATMPLDPRQLQERSARTVR